MTEDIPISKEDAIKKSEIFIAFRQLNGFSFVDGTISFNLLALTTQNLVKGEEIVLLINLIGINGMEENARKITCILQNDVIVDEGETKQADYQCLLPGLNITEGYTSIRLNTSEDIVGIPDDETLLNPYLTDEAIINNQIKNCSEDSSVPPSFVFETIDQSTCQDDGKFTIKGKIAGGKAIASNKFTVPLTYPEGTTITCSFEGENIECTADKELQDTIVIEQALITDGIEEIFMLKNITFDNMKCSNGLMINAEKKINVDISFRQVSHIQNIDNGLSFFFAAFVNTNLPASYQILMNVIVIINEEKVEKVASCILSQAVTTSGEPIQGDFNCVALLEQGENVAPENLTISTNNDNIGGCSELTKEEASPKAIDDAINDSQNAESELAVVVDYSLPENKNIKPPVFKIGKIDLGKCKDKGKLKITGKFTENIEEEMTFDLLFSFPISKVKCTVESANKNEDIEISCKMQKVKKFSTFKSIILEPRLIKKKRKEMLFIEGLRLTLDKEYECNDFNELKLMRAKARKSSDFSFLQIARPPSYSKLFFIALTKKNKEIERFESQNFSVNLIFPKRSRLRALQELDEKDVTITCDVGENTDNSCVFDCSSADEIQPIKVEITDDKIAGVSEENKVETDPNPDYSKIETLQEFDNLPYIQISNITSNNCSITGKYIIEATSDKGLDFTEKDNITIPFSNPDSSGLCTIKVTNKINLQITCENKEEFSSTEIIIPSQKINDKDDVTPLFKIENDYTAPTQFACAISDKSIKKLNISETNSTRYYETSSSGLNKGTIAAIIICCVVVVAIMGTLIVLVKKGFFSKQKPSISSIYDNSSIERFPENNKNINIF